MALQAYLTQTQSLLHDPTASYYSTTDLTRYINLSRGQIAAEGRCIRQLLPSTSGIQSITVTAGGNTYTSPPTVVITGPGSGATATATITSNAVSAVTVNTNGTGYDATTTITFTGGGGTGAAAVPVLAVNNATPNQEVFTFSSQNALLALGSGAKGVNVTLFDGVKSMVGLISVSVSWGALKPMLQKWPWSDFQAFLRSNNTGLRSYPAVWSQFAQGVSGSAYFYPVPSQILQWDWDVWCLPVDLIDDTTPEAVPYPFTDCIPFLAAYWAFLNSQRKQDADRMWREYNVFMKRARANSTPDWAPDPYDLSWI